MATKSKGEDPVLIGAHVTGGLKGAVSRALQIGAQVMQIFIGSPQTWKAPSPSEQDFTRFLQERNTHALGPLFVHGNYLVNLASGSPDNLSKSVLNLQAALSLSDQAGSDGLIFHPGSAGTATYKEALNRVLRSIEQVLAGYNGRCRLLLEVCAGQGETIGDRFCELADIIEGMGHDTRLGVCWDTCHLYNAGYDVSSRKGLESTIEEFAEVVGFNWLFAIHANDSKTPLGARRDRHENIGQGFIGEDGFRRMLHHKQLRKLPWILEVPGFERKGPDKENIDILKRLSSA